MTLDGHDLRDLRLADVRRAVTLLTCAATTQASSCTKRSVDVVRLVTQPDGFHRICTGFSLLQESLLFDASVRENSAFGRPEAGEHEIESAARSAAAHEFISNMLGGYDAGRWFVEHDDWGVADECPGDRDRWRWPPDRTRPFCPVTGSFTPNRDPDSDLGEICTVSGGGFIRSTQQDGFLCRVDRRGCVEVSVVVAD